MTRDKFFVRMAGPGKPAAPFLERGKWIVRGKPENMARLAELLKPLVEQGRILSLKYSVNLSAFGRKYSALIVYCNKRDRSAVKNAILSLGYHPRWKTNWETLLDSLPGGRRYEYEKRRLGRPPSYARSHVRWCKEQGIIPRDWDEKRIRRGVRGQYPRTRGSF